MTISHKFLLFTILTIAASNTVFATVNSSDSRYLQEVFNEVEVIKNVPYGASTTQGGTRETLIMDVYLPKGDTEVNRPLIIFAHGGFFTMGDKLGFEEEGIELAKSGYVVASINYRLLDVEENNLYSKFAVIDAVHDMKAAVRYFNKDNANDNTFGINPDAIFIGGYSAGAVTSLHYAFATNKNDILEMGGKVLLEYVIKNGGLEGNSGNANFSTKVKGVINIAGSLHSANLIDSSEPILFSIQGLDDKIVPYNSGVTGNTTVVTEGAGLLHKRANAIGLKNHLIAIPNEGHLARYSCSSCMSELRKFIFENL